MKIKIDYLESQYPLFFIRINFYSIIFSKFKLLREQIFLFIKSILLFEIPIVLFDKRFSYLLMTKNQFLHRYLLIF